MVRETDLKVLLCPEDMTQMAVGKEMLFDFDKEAEVKAMPCPPQYSRWLKILRRRKRRLRRAASWFSSGSMCSLWIKLNVETGAVLPLEITYNAKLSGVVNSTI